MFRSMVVPSFRKSVFFGDFFCYPVHGPESVKIGCAADQHHFFEFPGMETVSYTHLDVYKRQCAQSPRCCPHRPSPARNGGLRPAADLPPHSGKSQSGSFPPVSYTHLDVYKRQALNSLQSAAVCTKTSVYIRFKTS